MIFTRKYYYLLSNIRMNEILSALSCQLRAVKLKFSRTNLSLAVLTVFSIFLFSFMVKELPYYCCSEVKKVFYPLPSDNLHDAFHGTHDLILRKSDLEVPSKYHYKQCVVYQFIYFTLFMH